MQKTTKKILAVLLAALILLTAVLLVKNIRKTEEAGIVESGTEDIVPVQPDSIVTNGEAA